MIRHLEAQPVQCYNVTKMLNGGFVRSATDMRVGNETRDIRPAWPEGEDT